MHSLPLRRLAPLLAAVAAALMILWATPAGATATPTPATTTSSGYVEGDISNPVTGTPPVPRPHTRSCTVSLADNFPSNDAQGNPQNFTGTYNPPKDCPGPCSSLFSRRSPSAAASATT